MKKVLFCASTLSHLMNFHLPYLQDFRDQGYEVWTLAGGGKARFIPYAHHQEDLPIRKRFFSPKNLLAILKVRRLLLRENFDCISTHTTLASAVVRAAVLLLPAALIRVLVIPRFRYMPGRFQMALEEVVGLFDGMAKNSSPHRFRFMGAYIFSAGFFVFVGTLFELLGFQAVTVHGHPITLPAPLSDVNAAIAMGTLSYLVILSGGVASNGVKGVGRTLKEFSLPISMSFRLFGALLSGLLVTELVYYYVNLSFVLPVVVGVLFTLLHALVQTYVLTMLVSMYYGEVSEPAEPKLKKKKADAKT